jgi:toxin ParE1/3/4
VGLKVRYHRRARADFAEIKSYLAENAGRASAERVRRHLLAKIERLARLPMLGVATTELHIRVLQPTKYPYRIYYTTTDIAIVVLHVRHTARAPPELGDLV